MTSRSVSGRNSVSADAAEVKRVESEVEGVMMSGVAIEKSGLSSSSSVGVSAGQLIPKSGSGGEVPATGANSLQCLCDLCHSLLMSLCGHTHSMFLTLFHPCTSLLL